MKKISKLLGLTSLALVLSVFGFGNNLARAATPVLTSVAITPTAPSVVVGNTVQLTATPQDQNGIAFSGATTIFESSNPSIATVNSTSGLVTGVSAGTDPVFAISFNGSTVVAGMSIVTVTPATSLPGTLAAQDFGVVNYDTGLGILTGYTAGFGLTDATFTGAKSVVVKLYSGTTLLQTNTAILPKFNTDITGTQFSSPFDVSGTFNYATDGYWTNVRKSQYGQSMPATKVIATVTLANGKIVTAENDTLTGDPTTIYPVAVVANVVTNPATTVTSTDAILNGANGNSAATGHSFWVSLTPFVTTSPIIPTGVYSTPDMGAIAANATFSAPLSSLTTGGVPTNLSTITPNTTYYFAAWSMVNGTWYPGQVLTFKTTPTTVGHGGDKNENENEGTTGNGNSQGSDN
jgi:hypothetical protein